MKWFTVKHSKTDPQTSSYPKTSASKLLGLQGSQQTPAISSTDKILFSFQKWHWVWHILCLTTTAIAKDLSIELRSKGDPPKLLQHHVQQKLMSSYVPDEKALIGHLKKKDEFHTTRAPFRESPYKFEGRGIFQLPAQHK